MFEVTEDWIREYATDAGGWTRDQLRVLGEGWPPKSGWIKRAVGRRITIEERIRFEQRVTM